MILNRRMQLFVGLATVAALASGAEELGAATLEVTATVPDACTVNSGALAFGEYTPGQTASLEATGTFEVDCVSAADVNILLSAGQNFAQGGNGRAMSNPSTGDFLNYDLIHPVGFGGQWGDDGVTVANPSAQFDLQAGPTPISVEGTILPNQTVGGGTYSDTVEITLVFN